MMKWAKLNNYWDLPDHLETDSIRIFLQCTLNSPHLWFSIMDLYQPCNSESVNPNSLVRCKKIGGRFKKVKIS